MGTSTFVEDFKKELEFTPVKGQPAACIIHPHRSEYYGSTEVMTENDWDKFEKDIADAFEQVP